MSLLGKAVEALTLGYVHEVDTEEAEGQDTAQVVSDSVRVNVNPGTPSVFSPAKSSVTTDEEVNKAISTRATSDLETVMQATSNKFKQFLLKKQEYAELLRDGGTTDESKIELLASTKAVKSTKLTMSDVSQAADAARQALAGLTADFSRALEESRHNDVVQPTQSIQSTEKQVQDIRGQIAELETKIHSLESGIEPARAQITTAQAKLNKAQTIFNGSCAKVTANIKTMEAAILAAMQKRS